MIAKLLYEICKNCRTIFCIRCRKRIVGADVLEKKFNIIIEEVEDLEIGDDEDDAVFEVEEFMKGMSAPECAATDCGGSYIDEPIYCLECQPEPAPIKTDSGQVIPPRAEIQCVRCGDTFEFKCIKEHTDAICRRRQN